MNAVLNKILLIFSFLLVFASNGYCIQPNKYYAALTAEVSPTATGSGTVYVNGNDDNATYGETCTNIKYSNSYRNYVYGSGWVVSTVNFTATAKPNDGYKFIRWEQNDSQVSTSSSYSANYEVSDTESTSSKTNAKEYKITAFFSPIDYTISFSANGGNGTNPSNITYNIESTNKTFPACPYTKTGYTFAGWKPHSNVGNWSTSEIFEALASVPTGKWGTVTLDAQWKEKEYADITITISGLAEGETIMLNIQKDNVTLYTVPITGKASGSSSVTIKDLPTGSGYSVSPVQGWNFAYDQVNFVDTFGLSSSGASLSYTVKKKTSVKKYDEKSNTNWKP